MYVDQLQQIYRQITDTQSVNSTEGDDKLLEHVPDCGVTNKWTTVCV